MTMQFRKRLIDVTGESFGRLTAKYYDVQHKQWICECECGGKISVNPQNLRTGRTKSCGCLRKDIKREFMTAYQKAKKEKRNEHNS